jgi:hypothetical protein
MCRRIGARCDGSNERPSADPNLAVGCHRGNTDSAAEI